MGYIPPIKDDQFLIYTNRQKNEKTDLAPTPPTNRVAFYRTNHHHRNLFHWNTSVDNSKQIEDIKKKAHKLESKLLGKGSYVDEII
ncbi:hypothetical protein ACERII_00595 [Evansella sp. AB-rgal1]|uniref:hypothetical protein n=1 Tax=Evansella sp. AB-rgal1 TaxID=3242696 RepID=UPI00359CF442